MAKRLPDQNPTCGLMINNINIIGESQGRGDRTIGIVCTECLLSKVKDFWATTDDEAKYNALIATRRECFTSEGWAEIWREDVDDDKKFF